MPYYRVEYCGYVEGEFSDEESAKAAFVERAVEDLEDTIIDNMMEVWNPDTKEWDSV